MKHLEISDSARKTIADEFKFVVKKMNEEKDPIAKLFYYSAAYGILPRIFNQEYNPLLIHIHIILQTSHSTIINKVQEIVRGIELAIKIPDKYFDSLEAALIELADKIEKNQDVNITLQKITNLTYIMVGNGYYLFQKGNPLM